MIKKLLLSLLLIVILNITSTAQTHPHIIVNKDDKAIILDKIKQHPWAAKVFSKLFNEVAPYVERHKTDPEWMLSRYLINRVPGKRYTTFSQMKRERN